MKNPRIKALASKAAKKIKSLSEAHESQIEAVYREFREQVANLESNADSLDGSSVTPIPQSTVSQQEQ